VRESVSDRFGTQAGRQTQEEKDAPVLPQRILHNRHRHAQLRLHISQERRLRLLRQKRIDPLPHLKAHSMQGAERRVVVFAVVLYHDELNLALVVLKRGQGGRIENFAWLGG
jgi:hypothetical protein